MRCRGFGLDAANTPGSADSRVRWTRLPVVHALWSRHRVGDIHAAGAGRGARVRRNRGATLVGATLDARGLPPAPVGADRALAPTTRVRPLSGADSPGTWRRSVSCVGRMESFD